MSDRILYLLGVVATGWAVTVGLRFLPFLIFAGRDRELPRWVERFGAFVSPVIIGGLIVYSYSGLEWKSCWPYLAGALTVGLQLWKRNPLVSILAGTILYMCVLNCGCTTRKIALDAENPAVSVSSLGVTFGDELVKPEEVPGILADYDVPKSRVVHILVDQQEMANLGEAKKLMWYLARAGYTRSVLVTEQHKYGESNYLEISVREDGVYAGETRVPPARVPELLKERKVPTGNLVNVFMASPDCTERANRLVRLIKSAGYRFVDVVTKNYSDTRVFRMDRKGLMYGPRRIDVEEALHYLANDGAHMTDKIVIFVDPDAKDKDCLRVVLRLTKVLEQGGYRHVEKNWTPEAKAAYAATVSESETEVRPVSAAPARVMPAPAPVRTPGKIRYKKASED